MTDRRSSVVLALVLMCLGFTSALPSASFLILYRLGAIDIEFSQENPAANP